jgi:uncharacterized protein (TIGR02246 family)
MLFCGAFAVLAQQNSTESAHVADEAAIRLLIHQRETAWNGGDVEAYRRLLTADADTLSGTGRTADGRDAILALYTEQRTGAYKGATTATPVESIRFLRSDVAVVNTRSRVTGLRGPDGVALPVREGRQTLIVTKDQGRWQIAAFRSCAVSPPR